MIDPYNYHGYSASRTSSPKNQKEAVLMWIQRNGSIDFQIASSQIGCSQLTARINELKRKGWIFDKTTKTGKNRFGHTFSKTIYSNARRV